MESRKKQRSEEKSSADDSRLGRFEIVKETQRVKFWRMLSASDRVALINLMNLLGRAHRVRRVHCLGAIGSAGWNPFW